MLIHHWTSPERARTALKRDVLKARRWRHFLEHEQRFVTGTSWAGDPDRWQADHSVRFTINTDAVPNKVHSINGNRTYLLTKGMVDRCYDPNAYRYESTEPDEEFVEGDIANFRTVIVEITLTPEVPDVHAQAIVAWAGGRSVVVGSAPESDPFAFR